MSGITSIPNIPTDSLYKFISVFGILLFFVSLIVPSVGLNSLSVSKYRLAYEIAKNSNKIKQYENIIIENKRVYDSLANNNLFPVLNYQYKSKIVRRDSSSYKLGLFTADTINHTQDLYIAVYDSVKFSKAELNHIYDSEDHYILFGNNGILFSIALIFIGFISWYRNNQIYQDLILKVESGYQIPEYKITPHFIHKIFKPEPVKTDEKEKILQNWNHEIQTKFNTSMFIVIIILFLLLLGMNDQRFVLYKGEKIEIVSVPMLK